MNLKWNLFLKLSLKKKKKKRAIMAQMFLKLFQFVIRGRFVFLKEERTLHSTVFL